MADGMRRKVVNSDELRHVLLSDNLARSFGISTIEQADEAARALNLGLAHFPNGEPITWNTLPDDRERREAANWWKKQRAKEAAASPTPQPTAPAPSYVTHNFLEETLLALVPAIGKQIHEGDDETVADVNKALDKVRAELAELTTKLAVVQERLLKGFDRGVWIEGSTYEKSEWVTFNGSLWIAQAATSDRPPSNNWRLAVRHGRDAR